jgi:hypothetical protein
LLAPDPIVRLGGYPLDNLFPGVVVLALAIVGAVAKTHTREKWFLLALGLSAFVLALGPQLYLTSQVPTAVELPYRWLYEVFPPMRALRAPIRFDALINFALAALAGLGGVTLRRRLESFRGGSKGPRWLTASSTVVILGLIALEELALPAAHTVVLPVAGEIPPVYLWLARQAPGVVLELPMMGPNAQNELDISNQYFTTYHWHTTPDGYSGFIPPRRGEIAYEFRKPEISARGLALLQALDVSEVVLPPGWQSAATGKAQRLALLQDFGNVGVYSVPPAGDVKPNLFKQLYLPSSVAVGASFQAYMVLTNHNPTPYAVKPTVLAQAEVHWSNNRVEKVTFPIPLVTSSVSVVPIPMTAPQSPGLYELRVQGIDPVVGRMDAGGVVNVGTELAREVVIPASVKLGAPLAATSVRGATLPVALTWLPYNKIDEYYSASVRLVSTEGDKKSNTDREPAVKTLLWEPDVPVPDQFELKVPSDIPPGKYQIEVLMYQAETDQDVLLLDKEGKPQPVIVLGQIQVQ